METAEYLARGLWTESAIEVSWNPDIVRPTAPGIEERIDKEWTRLLGTGRRVYDGQLCRVLEFQARGRVLAIATGPTTYREYHGTHRDGVPEENRANPLCVCAVVHTADGQLVLGCRSAITAESDGLWHVAGGHVESNRHRHGSRVLPAQAMREELHEELDVPPDAIRELRCFGFSRPSDTCKPELLFYARVDLPFATLRHDEEHTILVPVEATRAACLAFMESHRMVGSGRACLRGYADLLG